MSELPIGTRDLAEVIPDLSELLADPAAYLSQKEVRIGKHKPPLIAFALALFLVLVFAFIVSQEGVAQVGAQRGSWVMAGGCLLFVGVLLYWAWPVHCLLVLNQAGVELQYRDITVWCPWAVFNEPGEAIITGTDDFYRSIVLPISLAAVPLIEQRREGRVVASGDQVAAKQFAFLAQGQAQLWSPYEANPQEIGWLLLRLGLQLGAVAAAPLEVDAPADPQPRHANAIQAALPAVSGSSSPALAEGQAGGVTEPTISAGPARIDRQGWIVFPVTRLQLPSSCAGCGQPTDGRREYELAPYVHWSLRFVLWLYARRFRIALPWCVACERTRRARLWLFPLLGGLAGLGVGLFLAVMLVGEILPWCFDVVFIGLGAWLGSRLARREPFQAWYWEPDQTILFRFPSGAIAAQWVNPEATASEEA